MKRLPTKSHDPWARAKILGEIAEDYGNGLSIRQIAAKWDISYGCAHSWVTLSGVALRPQGGVAGSKRKKKRREFKFRPQSE